MQRFNLNAAFIEICCLTEITLTSLWLCSLISDKCLISGRLLVDLCKGTVLDFTLRACVPASQHCFQRACVSGIIEVLRFLAV
jgi:hypothetical protein